MWVCARVHFNKYPIVRMCFESSCVNGCVWKCLRVVMRELWGSGSAGGRHSSLSITTSKLRLYGSRGQSSPPAALLSSLSPSRPDSARNTAGLSGAIDLRRTLLSPERKPTILHPVSLSISLSLTTRWCHSCSLFQSHRSESHVKAKMIRVKHHQGFFIFFKNYIS